MSCNSCSNVTLPGVAGPAGPAGSDGSNGTGITSISWTSNSNSDPQGTPGTTDTYTISYSNDTTSTFEVTNGSLGSAGTDGAVLLKSIGAESADYTSASYGPPSISSGDGFPWVVAADTLSTDLDTLRLEGLAVFTQGDATKQLRIQADLVDVNVGVASYPLQGSGDIVGCKFVVDFVRTSITTLRVESESKMFFNSGNFGNVYDYATAQLSLMTEFPVLKNNQTITVSSDMGSNDFSIGLDILTNNAAQPLKLVNCKLLKFKKV